MKKLILIGGDLAGGKSTFSNLLKDKYNLFVINKDRLKEILGDTIIVDNREDNKKLSVISFNLMKYLLEKNESIMVLESNFKDYEMKELELLTNKLEYNVLSIRFTGDNEVLHKRFLKRLNENRHYVHKSEDFSNIEDFINCLNGLRNVKYIGKVINVDCTNFSYFNDDNLYNIIEEFIKT